MSTLQRLMEQHPKPYVPPADSQSIFKEPNRVNVANGPKLVALLDRSVHVHLLSLTVFLL